MLKWVSILFGVSILISQTAMDVSATLLVLTALFMGWRWRNSQSSCHQACNSIGFDWVFLVWISVVALGFGLNWNPESDWIRRLVEFKWIFVLYALVASFRYLDPTDKVIKPAAIIFSISCLYSIIVFYVGKDPIQPYPELTGTSDSRAGGPFSNPMTFAHVYGPVLIIFGGLVLSYIRWKEPLRWWTLVAFLLGSWAILLSGTRGVWLSVFIGFLVIAFLFSIRFGIIALLGGILLMGAMYFTIPSLRDRVDSTFNSSRGYDQERIYIWKAHFEIFKKKPILGVGYGETKKMLSDVYPQIGAPETTLVSHAHNQYLYFLAGTGVVGLFVYLGFLFGFLFLNLEILKRVSSRSIFHQGLALGAMGAQVSFILGGLTECNFEHSKVKYMMTVVWALVVWLAYEYRVLKDRL